MFLVPLLANSLTKSITYHFDSDDMSIFQSEISPELSITQKIAKFTNPQILSKFITTAVASPHSRSLYDNIIHFKILKHITSISSSFKLQPSIIFFQILLTKRLSPSVTPPVILL